uniref:Uncharacterized protein n=1 Tax=Anguilla anguilla TaxID=7936 RepID=A0A0E9SQP5_ANGAN
MHSFRNVLDTTYCYAISSASTILLKNVNVHHITSGVAYLY